MARKCKCLQNMRQTRFQLKESRPDMLTIQSRMVWLCLRFGLSLCITKMLARKRGSNTLTHACFRVQGRGMRILDMYARVVPYHYPYYCPPLAPRLSGRTATAAAKTTNPSSASSCCPHNMGKHNAETVWELKGRVRQEPYWEIRERAQQELS